jgi:hypothetical protein
MIGRSLRPIVLVRGLAPGSTTGLARLLFGSPVFGLLLSLFLAIEIRGLLASLGVIRAATTAAAASPPTAVGALFAPLLVVSAVFTLTAGTPL